MRPICWLHISDIHLRARDAWSQDVVLRAMCEDVARRRAAGAAADFILATGDMAYSGKAEEYDLSASFFDALSTAAGVTKERIFCIPGNHDIDRERQKLSFLGARSSLQSQSQVDELLTSEEEITTLLKRQESYRNFQSSYFDGQKRTETPDRLGYAATLVIEDIVLAIIGLNSAWLAEGGLSDHGKLLIGERQVINAISLAGRVDADVVIGMAHHPLHLLHDYDRRPVQNRVERHCHFFHCGHLHEPESRPVSCSSSGCLMLSAGASFETRHSQNTYSFITLDFLRGQRLVKTVQYNPGKGEFSFESSDSYRFEMTLSGKTNVTELAVAMNAYEHSLSPFSHYLAALLLDQKSEILIPGPSGYTFGSFAVLEAEPESDIKRCTAEFITFKNALRVLNKRLTLAEILSRHGAGVVEYGAALNRLCADWAIQRRLAEREQDARNMASAGPQPSLDHTLELFSDLAAARDWTFLRQQAQRHLESSNPRIAIEAKRMLALCLANSDERLDKLSAIELYRSLSKDPDAKLNDVANLATLLFEVGNFDDAKGATLDGIARFAPETDQLSGIGHRIVEATGDRTFRKQLEVAKGKRGEGG